MATFDGTGDIYIDTPCNLDNLIPYVRLRLGDVNPATYRYVNSWLRAALVVAVETLGKWMNFKYLIDSNNNVYRNTAFTDWIFDEATHGILEVQDLNPIVIMATIIITEGGLENSSWDVASWRDNEISFSNLESARTKDKTIARLWDELLNTLKPPSKRLAKSIKGSLPGYKFNMYERDITDPH